MEVGFVGLGRMGQGMARNLLQAGHEVTAYNRNRQRSEELAGGGARVAATPAEACQGEVVITMLADDVALQAVVDEAEPSLRPGLLHISMETISVDLSERLDQRHAAAGRSYVAAPVIGRPEAAAAAKLFILAAGTVPALERSRPLLEAMEQRTFPFGERPAKAHLAKLAVNFLLASVIESLAESFALVRKAGLSADAFLELITSSIFSAPVYKIYGGLIAAQKYEPAGFAVPLGLKDVRLALAAAEAHGVPLPLAALVRDHLLDAIAQGQEKHDWASVGRVCARNAGLES